MKQLLAIDSSITFQSYSFNTAKNISLYMMAQNVNKNSNQEKRLIDQVCFVIEQLSKGKNYIYKEI